MKRSSKGLSGSIEKPPPPRATICRDETLAGRFLRWLIMISLEIFSHKQTIATTPREVRHSGSGSRPLRTLRRPGRLLRTQISARPFPHSTKTVETGSQIRPTSPTRDFEAPATVQRVPQRGDCGHAVWRSWCWSSRPPSSNGIVRDCVCPALALQARAAVSGSRDSRSDSANEQRQPALGAPRIYDERCSNSASRLANDRCEVVFISSHVTARILNW
jgi:hypothetical protein